MDCHPRLSLTVIVFNIKCTICPEIFFSTNSMKQNTMAQNIFVVIESVDGLITNCFTNPSVAQNWANNQSKLDNSVRGPFNVNSDNSIEEFESDPNMKEN